MGTWYGLTVQIRQISGKNVLVTAITGSSVDKYFPRGDNFWDRSDFNKDPNAINLQSCLNAGTTGYDGLGLPAGLTPPPGYIQGQEADGAIYFSNGNVANPCDFSTPRRVGTWNGLVVQIRQFPNNISGLVTAFEGSSNDKYLPRGDNFWDNFTKDANVEQYRACLNAGESSWYGLSKPGSVTPPPGYLQGYEPDGAIFFSTNGARKAAPVPEVPAELPMLIRVRPNPAHYELTVTFDLLKAQSVPVRLLDMQGKVVQQQTYPGEAGRNERVLNVAPLPVGMYMLEVKMDGQRIIQKVLKE
ncbi:T9SS type A sorting domain-containing protein [Nibrella viscosa]|uniref:T9SS type A sorting domain-containing protein n=1 Tax=Nibrella viscosa TaxID=1084524 RepID=UPI0031E99C63